MSDQEGPQGPKRAIEVVRRNLRRLRHESGLSQTQLAMKADVARAHLGRIETEGRNVSVKTLFALADALGVSPSELVEE